MLRKEKAEGEILFERTERTGHAPVTGRFPGKPKQKKGDSRTLPPEGTEVYMENDSSQKKKGKRDK